MAPFFSVGRIVQLENNTSPHPLSFRCEGDLLSQFAMGWFYLMYFEEVLWQEPSSYSSLSDLTSGWTRTFMSIKQFFGKHFLPCRTS